MAIGTQMLELDCHLTKDGEVVVSHDQNLLRSTGVDKNISELNYKDLPLLKQCLPIDFDPGIVICYFKKNNTLKENYLKTIVEYSRCGVCWFCKRRRSAICSIKRSL